MGVSDVILTEDLKLVMATHFGGRISSKQREAPDVRKVSRGVSYVGGRICEQGPCDELCTLQGLL